MNNFTRIYRPNNSKYPTMNGGADMRNVLGIILGGGRGTRLHPLTQLRAKPAVPLAGKYRLIDIPVSNCLNSAIQKIYVLTQFNSASLNRHVSRTYQISPFSEGFVEILAAQQTPEHSHWFQGTADAVRQYLTPILETNVDTFLILSGDHLYRMDYRPFIEHHRKIKADITLSVLPVGYKHASDFGLVKIDDKGGVTEFSEKPKGEALKAMEVDTQILGLEADKAKNMPFIASMGIYVFTRKALVELLTDNQSEQDFGKEIIPGAIDHMDVQAFLFKGYWEDIGTIEAFYDANLALTKYPNPPFSFYDEYAPIYTHQRFLPPSKIQNSDIKESMISEGCIIEKAEIQHSILGIRSRIESGCTIQNSLIMGSDYYQTLEDKGSASSDQPMIGIGENSVINRAIIDKNARIGKNVRLINEKNIQEADEPIPGVYINAGIIIVTKNSTLPDNTVI